MVYPPYFIMPGHAPMEYQTPRSTHPTRLSWLDLTYTMKLLTIVGIKMDHILDLLIV